MTPVKTIRTRIAPSPTGDPHIGTAYQLLFDYAFAKSQGGQCILRIEDTDQARSTRESENAILESLRWLGLQWDEGPDVGGPFGPYRQSERAGIYREHAEKLLESGRAYRCFCTPEELAEIRREQEQKGLAGYDKRCSRLSGTDIRKRLDAGAPFTLRLDVPEEGECVVHDLLRGEIRTPWKEVDDQVLMKSDGLPTYHLANVVDDHLMEITHVIRGEEWISSAPKHLLLYEAFGWEPPTLCHLPLLRNPDKSKLSKRKNPTSIGYYRSAGYLPEALLNYMGLVGYTPPDGREIFTLEEMVETFDIKRVSLGGPIFDVEKLAWLNGRYLRERMTPQQLLERLRDWAINDDVLSRIVPLAQPRLERLSDFVPLVSFFFGDRPVYAVEDLVPKKVETEEVARLLQIVLRHVETMQPWNAGTIKETLGVIAEKEDIKIRDLLAPLFVAVTGSRVSTPLFESMEILGRDMVRRRIFYAIDQLAEAGHGLSKKKLKELDKHIDKVYGGLS